MPKILSGELNMRKKFSSQEQEADVDMTPMLDIVFIMLIFFIVTSSFIKESAIVIDRPSRTEDIKPEPSKAVLIKVSELNDINFAGRDILIDAVRANVEIALSENPEVLFRVKIAEKAGAGTVVDIVDQVRLAGVDKVTVSRL